MPNNSLISEPRVSINLANLRHNANIARQLLNRAKTDGQFMAVIKANAYGHGTRVCAEALSDCVDGFAVARLDEALQLRQWQPVKPILIMSGVYSLDELTLCLENQFDIVVHQEEQIELLEALFKKSQTAALKSTLRIWLKMDSGMHRLGIATEHYNATYQRIQSLSFISDIIAMHHFASADDKDNPFNQQQRTIFLNTIQTLPNKPAISMANSAALLHNIENIPNDCDNWVRPGLMLYGINPTPSIKQPLKPVMTLQAPIIALKKIKQGETVGYNQTWQSERDSLIATVALGYGDGYPTTLKQPTPVLIHQQRANIVGRVSMDSINVDCTDIDFTEIETISIGDTVTFWGEDETGQILAIEEIAKCAATIPYDLVSKITTRVKNAIKPNTSNKAH